MASSIQVKRGTTAKVAAYTPLSGELVLDTTTNKLYAGDGSTAGGNQILASRKGITDGSSAATGEVGESITGSVTSVSVTSTTEFNITSVVLTPGVWEVRARVKLTSSSGVMSSVQLSLSTTSATGAAFPNRMILQTTLNNTQQLSAPTINLNITANTTVYLVGYVVITSGTYTADGNIQARRIR